jgi:mRNA-degrading endonuclease HigB of HigAB toxin-antitoxin module
MSTNDGVPPYANTSPDNSEWVVFNIEGKELRLRVTTSRVGGGKVVVRRLHEEQDEGRH